MSRRMQTSWKLFLHTARREMAEPRGTDTSKAAGETRATPAPQPRMHRYPWQKPPRLTEAAAGGGPSGDKRLSEAQRRPEEGGSHIQRARREYKFKAEQKGEMAESASLFPGHLAMAQPSFKLSWSCKGDVF